MAFIESTVEGSICANPPSRGEALIEPPKYVPAWHQPPSVLRCERSEPRRTQDRSEGAKISPLPQHTTDQRAPTQNAVITMNPLTARRDAASLTISVMTTSCF